MEKKEKKSKVRQTFDLKPKKPKKPSASPSKIKEDTTSDILDILGITQDDVKRINKAAEERKKSDKIVARSLKSTKRPKRYKPRKIKGKKVDGFADYIRSPSELKEVMKEKLGTSKLTLDNVIKLFGDYKIKITDNTSMIFDYDIKEINKYREYDRTRENGGKLTPEEWDALYADIKKNGIKNYGVLHIDRNKNGNLQVLLGEGNHRLAMAKKLKIKKMPLMISYYP